MSEDFRASSHISIKGEDIVEIHSFSDLPKEDKNMTSFKQYFFVLLAFYLGTGMAFQQYAMLLKQPALVSSPSPSRCFLHPDQAADLEACAYDLTREFLEEERRKKEAAAMVCEYNTPINPNSMAASFPGPVAWCRRRLWPFVNADKNTQDLRP